MIPPKPTKGAGGIPVLVVLLVLIALAVWA